MATPEQSLVDANGAVGSAVAAIESTEMNHSH
jgi:hypothetical protein